MTDGQDHVLSQADALTKNFEGVLGKIYVQIPGYLDRSMRVLNYNGEKHGDQCFPSFPLSPHSIVLFNLL